jgi:hypothetical protein
VPNTVLRGFCFAPVLHEFSSLFEICIQKGVAPREASNLMFLFLGKNVPVRGEIIFPRVREENLMLLIALLIRTIKFCHETRYYQSNYLLLENTRHKGGAVC